MAKVAFVRGLNIRPVEFTVLEKMTPVAAADATSPTLLDSFKAISANLSPQVMETHSPVFSAASAKDLEILGRAVADLRGQAGSEITALLRAIQASYAHVRGKDQNLVSIPDALSWAYQQQPPELQQLIDLVTSFLPVTADVTSSQALLAQLTGLLQEAAASNNLVDNFLLSFSFEPVGRIHLERIEMTPVGVEHGELVYSVPLTPKETVNISHREWSQTTSTFENVVQDFFEGYSEKGVTEKTDLSTATSNESKHSSSFDANASVSFSYNGNPYSLTTSAGIDYKTTSDNATSIKDSRAHSMAVTSIASARTRKEHKQSFKVSSVAGTEDLAVRVLTNPSGTDAMRVDYLRLMRRWQVDLIRYGLRMTYDLVIPNPGNALTSKVLELQSIEKVLNTEYVFPLKVSDIPDDYQAIETLASQFGVAVGGPPQPPGDMEQHADLQKTDEERKFGNFQFNVQDEYEVVSARIWSRYTFLGDKAKNLHFGVRGGPDKDTPQVGGFTSPGVGSQVVTDVIYDSNDPTTDPNHLFSDSLAGKSGEIGVDYMYYHVDSGSVTATLTVKPKTATIETWRMNTWGALQKAGQNQFNTGLNALKDRKAQLEKDIDSYDSLTLRRMEREEIMRLVLVWLFGPNFQFVPTTFDLLGLVAGSLASTPDPLPEISLDPGQMTLPEWDSVRKYGEFIKYIHNAIEWENVLFFTYPYFWDLVENWSFKRFLVHPDFDHRNFLRAGCARVVVPVRPGFEPSFAQLVEHFTLPTDQSDLGGLPANHPYVQIGDEMRNFAMTNYEHIPPANPDRNVRLLLHPLQIRAWKEMQAIMLALEKYNVSQQLLLDPKATQPYQANIYPRSIDDDGNAGPGLKALKDVVNPVTKQHEDLFAPLQLNDPWGRPYVYSCPGDRGEDYDLVCYGKGGNQQSSGDGLDAWIASYAEGNVVSRWYEYTPTGGMDVAITMIPPTNFQLPTKPEPV